MRAICDLEARLELRPTYPAEYQRRLTERLRSALEESSRAIAHAVDIPRLEGATSEPLRCRAVALLYGGEHPPTDAESGWALGAVGCTSRELLWTGVDDRGTVYRSLLYHVIAVHQPETADWQQADNSEYDDEWEDDESDDAEELEDADDLDESSVCARRTVFGRLRYPARVELLGVTRTPPWRRDLWIQLPPESDVLDVVAEAANP